MDCNFNSIEIAEGVHFNSIIDKRFKTNKISINFITELKKETVTSNAIIPFLLKKGYNGCSDYTIFNQQLEELYGAYVASYVQKVGDYQVVSLSITSIDDVYALNNDEITSKTASILCEMAFNPILENGVFPLKDVEIEKTALIDTIEAEVNEKRIYAINNLVKVMCSNEPFGISKYGYTEQVALLTPETIKTAYDNLIKHSRVEIMFTGSGNDKTAIDVFKAKMSSVNRSYQILNPIATHSQLQQTVEQTDHMTVSQSKMVLGFGNGLEPSSNLITATKLMVALYGGTPSSKLFLNVREKLSLCYYCAARYDRFKGIMMVDCGVENQNIEKAKTEILSQLDAIKKGEITDDEIRNAALSLVNALKSVYDSDASIESWYLGQVLSGTNISPLQEVDKVNNVTKECIIEAANRCTLDAVYVLTGKEV
ncbi:insulinase family protein [Paludicola sp. MB14-C6]|uniref:EF-P 5-aminopentanol modification-associated protein YfmF n=1 Tax=Paludihabitans sp. MB14-C6 TaxID=3070656 RepID=UPI0027DB3800|nr:insulinase family protein [Paludicola sp. MB14-C6]WMJ23328.1 insulinase family protein [Paludicola sp. MB14-C6]